MSNICSCAILDGIHTLKVFLRYSFVYQISEVKTLRSGLHWDTFPGNSSWNLSTYCSSHGGTGWWNHSMSEPWFFTLLQIKKDIYIILYIWMIFWDDLGCIPVCIISYYEYSWMLFFRVAHHLSCNPSWQLESWGAVVWENVSTEQLGRFGVDGVLLKLYIYITGNECHIFCWNGIGLSVMNVFSVLCFFCENTSWT